MDSREMRTGDEQPFGPREVPEAILEVPTETGVNTPLDGQPGLRGGMTAAELAAAEEDMWTDPRLSVPTTDGGSATREHPAELSDHREVYATDNGRQWLCVNRAYPDPELVAEAAVVVEQGWARTWPKHPGTEENVAEGGMTALYGSRRQTWHQDPEGVYVARVTTDSGADSDPGAYQMALRNRITEVLESEPALAIAQQHGCTSIRMSRLLATTYGGEGTGEQIMVFDALPPAAQADGSLDKVQAQDQLEELLVVNGFATDTLHAYQLRTDGQTLFVDNFYDEQRALVEGATPALRPGEVRCGTPDDMNAEPSLLIEPGAVGVARATEGEGELVLWAAVEGGSVVTVWNAEHRMGAVINLDEQQLSSPHEAIGDFFDGPYGFDTPASLLHVVSDRRVHEDMARIGDGYPLERESTPHNEVLYAASRTDIPYNMVDFSLAGPFELSLDVRTGRVRATVPASDHVLYDHTPPARVIQH